MLGCGGGDFTDRGGCYGLMLSVPTRLVTSLRTLGECGLKSSRLVLGIEMTVCLCFVVARVILGTVSRLLMFFMDLSLLLTMRTMLGLAVINDLGATGAQLARLVVSLVLTLLTVLTMLLVLSLLLLTTQIDVELCRHRKVTASVSARIVAGWLTEVVSLLV